MVGGLLNIISYGIEDVILIGNPNKTFFKKIFASHTNFGKQKFRIDFEGQTRLNYNSGTTYNFKIPRYADLLQEIYFSFTLPNIWSPLLSWGGTTAMFCSACRTQIQTNLDSLQGAPDAYTSFTNDMGLDNCDGCGCKCETRYGFWNINIEGTNEIPRTETPTKGGMKWINKIFPFEFRWIENIGVQAIRSVRILANNNVIQEFTGQYLLNMVYRDFSDAQKKIFDRMIGNTKDLTDPANFSNRNGNYPNAAYFGSLHQKMPYGLEPSIRSRQLYIPINLWSTLNNKTPLPLVSMQYSELRIEVEMRPVNEWWIVKNLVNDLSIKFNGTIMDPQDQNPLQPFQVLNQVSSDKDGLSWNEETQDFDKITPGGTSSAPILKGCSSYLIQNPIASLGEALNLVAIMPLTYTAPNAGRAIYNLKYFLKEPPPKMITDKNEDFMGSSIPEVGALPYPIPNNSIIERYYAEVPEPWFADVHLIGCYTFLSDEEQHSFANNCQSYLIKEVHEQNVYNLLGGQHFTPIKTNGLVISWMWFFQRSDIKYRNEWSNYTNYNYNSSRLESTRSMYGIANPYCMQKKPFDGKLNNIVWQDSYSAKDIKDILINWGLNFNSSVREIVLDNGIIAWVDRYSRSQGSGIDGVYYYNFCLNTDPLIYQPSGAINISKFNTVNWIYQLEEPLKKSIPKIMTGIEEYSNYENEYRNTVDPFLSHLAVNSYLSNKISKIQNCDVNTQESITTHTNIADNYVWSYSLHIMEERYNILKIVNGVANLVLSRNT